MDSELLNKIGNMDLYAFYDKSKNMVTVHFMSKEDDSRPDLMAYMLLNGSWDLREVASETSELHEDRDVVTIKQKRIIQTGKKTQTKE